MRETTLLQNDVRQVKNPDVCKRNEKQDRGKEWGAAKKKKREPIVGKEKGTMKALKVENVVLLRENERNHRMMYCIKI